MFKVKVQLNTQKLTETPVVLLDEAFQTLPEAIAFVSLNIPALEIDKPGKYNKDIYKVEIEDTTHIFAEIIIEGDSEEVDPKKIEELLQDADQTITTEKTLKKNKPAVS